MRKKYLSALLFGALVMASTVTFTSCIDNDEPAGIENLRGAKAELLRAKVAVEEAKAAYKLAEAEVQKSIAAQNNALVEYQKLLNESQRLDNELKAAQNEKEIADLQAKIEQINADLATNKLTWEANKLQAEAGLAQAQKAYDDAMKALELSKDLISDAESAQLEWAKGKLEAARVALYGTGGLKDQLEGAYDAYKGTITASMDDSMLEGQLAARVVACQTALKKLQDVLAIKEGALEALKSSDPYKAWVALSEEYKTKSDSLTSVLRDKYNQKVQIVAENQDAIKALQDSISVVNGFKSPSSAAAEDSISTKIDDVIRRGVFNAIASAGGSFITVDGMNNEPVIKANFNSISTMAIYQDSEFDVDYNYLSSNKPDAPTDDFSDVSQVDNYISLLENTYAFDDRKNSAYAIAVKNIDDVVANLEETKAALTEYEIGKIDLQIETLKAQVEVSKKAADADVAAWEAFVAKDNDYTKFNADLAALNTALQAAIPGGIAEVTAAYTKYTAFKDNCQKYNQVAFPVTEAEWDKDMTAFSGKLLEIQNALTGYNYIAKNRLTTAQEAFGDLGVVAGQGIVVRPSDDEVRDNGYDGTYGIYLRLSDELAELEEMKDQVAKYDAVIAKLNEWKTALATLKGEYMKKAQVAIDKVANNQKNVIQVVDTPIKALGIEADEHTKGIIDDVLNGVKADPTINRIQNYGSVVETLENEIGTECTYEEGTHTGLKHDITVAEKSLKTAENLMALYKAGNLSEQHLVQWAEEELEIAKNNYNNGVTVFNYWNDKVQEMLAKLYGSAAE